MLPSPEIIIRASKAIMETFKDISPARLIGVQWEEIKRITQLPNVTLS